MSKAIVSVSPGESTESALSGSDSTARTIVGAVTPALPLIVSAPWAMGDVRGALRSRPSTCSALENSPPHRQRAARRFSSPVSGCDSETNAVKPWPVSVTRVPPRLGPPSGETDEKMVGCT